jgi:hypothetical protein
MVDWRRRSWLVLMLFFALVFPRATRAEAPAKAAIPPDSPPRPAQPQLTFAAYGDIPYEIKLPNGRTDDQVLFEDITPALRQRQDIPFIINLGDLGRTESTCNNNWLRKTQVFWETKLVIPVFYTPGDNDWADCDRLNLKVRQSENGRLQHLRNIFFSRPKNVTPVWKLEQVQAILTRNPQLKYPDTTLEAIRRVVAMDPSQFARDWHYETEPELPENAIWMRNGVLFVTLHFISTDNGRSEIYIDDPKKALALVDERDRQDKRWLNRAFEQAKQLNAKAVVGSDPAGSFWTREETGNLPGPLPQQPCLCWPLQTG